MSEFKGGCTMCYYCIHLDAKNNVCKVYDKEMDMLDYNIEDYECEDFKHIIEVY